MFKPRRSSDAFNQDESGDFIIRRRIIPIWQLITLFLLCFTVLFVVATNSDMLGGSFGLGLSIFAIIGPLTWFTVYFSQQNRDMLLAAEFQNALFSAAARLKTKFVMIIKRDGTVYYFDRSFQKMFPETNSRGMLMIDKIFSTEQISRVEADKLFRALEEQRSETVFVHLLNEKQEEQKVIITVDPLPSPSGFYILRGRDYVVKRYERNPAQPNRNVKMDDNPYLSATISHMMQTMPYGLYTTDAQGNILFMNYRLESWLGYSQNETASKTLTLMDLIPQQNTATAENILVENCEGEVHFKNKDGRNIQMFMQQEITKDEMGNLVGSVAILRPEKPMSMDIASKPAMAAARHADEDERPAASLSLTAGKKF